MTGVAPRVCLGIPGETCARRVFGRSRCADHASAFEQQREAARSGTRDLTNPWRWVYRDRRWKPARRACFLRDEYRCIDCGHFDPTGATLQADHSPALQDRPDAEETAFDIDLLKTRCAGAGTSNCHARAEAKRRRARRS